MKLRPMALDDLFFDDELEAGDEQEQKKGSTIVIDFDELEAFQIFGKGCFSLFNAKLLPDADFFNAFEDDFDDADIN